MLVYRALGVVKILTLGFDVSVNVAFGLSVWTINHLHIMFVINKLDLLLVFSIKINIFNHIMCAWSWLCTFQDYWWCGKNYVYIMWLNELVT